MITNELSTNTESTTNLTVSPEQIALEDIIVYRGNNIVRTKNCPMQQTSYAAIVDEIRHSPDLKNLVTEIRNCTDEKEQEELKKLLPYITFGRFEHDYLKNEYFLGNKFLCLDFDHLGDKVSSIREIVTTDPYILSVSVTSRGEGLRPVYEMDQEITDPEQYVALYNYYRDLKSKEYGVQADETTHNTGRAFFLTHDPDMFVNEQRIPLPTDVEWEGYAKQGITRAGLLKAAQGSKEGSRNNDLFIVTCALIDSGIDVEIAIQLMLGLNLRNTPPLPETDVIRTVKHAYISYPHPANLKRAFTHIYRDLAKKKTESVEIGQIYFSWLKENKKARFFTDEQLNHYVYLNNRLIRIDEHDSDFESLLLKTANISTATPLGKVVTQVVGATAHLEGKRIEKSTWLQTDHESLTIYLNLKNDRNELLEITASGLTVIQNGSNDADVFMLNTLEDKLHPVSYVSQSDSELRESLDLAESNIIKHIPCDEDDRWMAYVWRMSYPLFDLTTAHLILRFQGSPEQGKTTASRLLSYSLYGRDFTDKSTVASMYSDASVNPLILDDNLESKNFADPGRSDFYLGAATGGGRQKRDVNSASGLINEKTRALLLCNGIESIAKSEHTSRMMIIQCDRTVYGSDYTSAVLLNLKRHRDRILSAEYEITHRVLSRIDNGDWHTVQQLLKEKYPGHSKSRMFEHLAILIMYLEEAWKALGKPDDPWTLVDKWMKKQNITASDEIRGTDPIIQALEILRESALKQTKLESSIYDPKDLRNALSLDTKTLLVTVSLEPNGMFVCAGRSGSLLSAFSVAYQTQLKKQFPISASRVLSQRIISVKSDLKAAGYDLKIEEDKHNKQNEYTFTWTPGV